MSVNTLAQNEYCDFKEECVCDSIRDVSYSVQHSDVIIHAMVIKIDTVSIEQTITHESILQIKNDTLSKSDCAKKVLENKKVIKVKVRVLAIFKGKIKAKEIFIQTPLGQKSCEYSNFKLNQEFIIYGTQNETADIYFLWTFDLDYFKLKPKYSIWTNKCKRTMLVQESEINKLRELKK